MAEGEDFSDAQGEGEYGNLQADVQHQAALVNSHCWHGRYVRHIAAARVADIPAGTSDTERSHFIFRRNALLP